MKHDDSLAEIVDIRRMTDAANVYRPRRELGSHGKSVQPKQFEYILP